MKSDLSRSKVRTARVAVLFGWPRPAALAMLLVAVLAGSVCAVEMTEEQADELAAIRAAIDSAGAHWVAEPNEISLLPKEEFRAMLGGGWPPEVKAVFDTLRPRSEDLNRTYPEYWDWREMDGTTPIKDQGNCGSCWDFAATGALECNVRVNEGVVLDLSEQQGLDCNDGGSDCGGGWQGDAYAVYTDPGAVSEECMPYTAMEGTCSQRLCEKVAIMDGFQWVAGNVDSYKAALMEGPISTCYTVYEDFNEYSGGCYQHVWGAPEAGHCIVIVGWDDSMCGGDGAWICKNSWGGGWGLNGYFYIKFNDSGIGYGAELPINAHIPRERFVPDEYATIQSAMDNSNRGDVIRVAGGTYNENVVIDDYRKLYGGYDPTFQVRDLVAYPTVIDAGGSGHGVTISGQRNVVLDGFEIRNATGSGSYGVRVAASDATVRNCEIHDCYRGINVSDWVDEADVIIERCVVRDNADHGIYLSGEYYENVEVRLSASFGNGGDGLHSNRSPVNVQYCTLAANDGDGMDLRWTSGNEVRNSILSANGEYGLASSVATPDNGYNCVWGNASGDYSNCSAGPGALLEDPIFCDPPIDVSVHATSPTLGAAELGDDMGALGIGCPAGPSDLTVVQNGALLELSWIPPEPSRADVDHYIVYRDTTQYHATAIATVDVPSSSFSDITIPACVTHNYWVSAVDTDSLESAVSNRGYAQLCYDGPSGLFVDFDQGGNELSWSVGEGSIDRYAIMRSTIVDPPDSVGAVYAPTTTFVDASTSSCPRDNYIYEVVPIYDTGWWGQSTEPYEIDPPPAAPSDVSAEWVGNDIVLNWSPNCESDFRQHWVYRDTMPLTPPPLHEYRVGQTSDTTYVDEDLNPDWNYFYRIVSGDASFKKSGYSNMAYVAEPESHHVPSQYATIQAAIDAASPPDTVVVGPGTYSENVILKDGVLVRSSDGRVVTTITSPVSPVVKAPVVCDLTLLDGFTVDGQGSASTGVESWGSYVRLENCVLKNCQSGALFKFGGEPTAYGNTFTMNQYGITVSDSAAPSILSNTFDSNTIAAVNSSGSPGPRVGGALSSANDFLNRGYFQVFNSGPDELYAAYNYWDDLCPDPAWFYGPVDYSPWTDDTHTEVLTECTGIPGGTAVAHAGHNFPNPFNPKTTIRYMVPEPGAEVEISIYNLAGRRVRALVSERQSPGEHSAVWAGRDERGQELASGVYFYRVRIGDYRAERKMLLLK